MHDICMQHGQRLVQAHNDLHDGHFAGQVLDLERPKAVRQGRAQQACRSVVPEAHCSPANLAPNIEVQ